MSYSPTLGRFLQRDPLGYVDGGSLYEYVGSSPADLLDPSGLRRPDYKSLPQSGGGGGSFGGGNFSGTYPIGKPTPVLQSPVGVPKGGPNPGFSTGPQPLPGGVGVGAGAPGQCVSPKYGNCTKEQHWVLNKRVGDLCKNSGKLSCDDPALDAMSPSDRCTELANRKARSQACFLARKEMNDICFSPPIRDRNHQDEQDRAEQVYNTCRLRYDAECASSP